MAAREVTFEVRGNELVRHVRLADGRAYRHCCSLPVFQDVAWYIQEHLGQGLSTNELWKVFPKYPFTQINVALAFLADRGCVVRTGRLTYGRAELLYEDAMEAFYHLAEVKT